MTDLRAQIASALVDLEYEPGVFVRDDESLADLAGRMFDAGFRLIPENSVLVTRETLDADLRVIRQYLTLFGARGRDEQIALAALDRILAALTPEPTNERHGPYGNEGYCYCGVYMGHSGWSQHLTPEPTDAPAEPLTTAVDAKAARGACAICGHNRSDPFHDERSSGFHEYERRAIALDPWNPDGVQP
jgi:hypothetical protein